jgi:hypothetical protein
VLGKDFSEYTEGADGFERVTNLSEVSVAVQYYWVGRVPSPLEIADSDETVTPGACLSVWLAAWLPGCLPACLSACLPGWLAGWLCSLCGWSCRTVACFASL